jgi:hypothetical protein
VSPHCPYVFEHADTSRRAIEAATAELNAKMEATAAMGSEAKEKSMKLLMQCKISVSNIMKDLDALDSYTEDWPKQGNLRLTASAIHLRCESASNECQGIFDVLDCYSAAEERDPFEEGFMTIVVRHEFATGKVNQITALLGGVITACTGDEEEAELGVEEMKLRVDAIMATLAEVKKCVDTMMGLCGGMVVKWQAQSINACIYALQSVVGQLAETMAAEN